MRGSIELVKHSAVANNENSVIDSSRTKFRKESKTNLRDFISVVGPDSNHGKNSIQISRYQEI
jgi:hypothetical protein